MIDAAVLSALNHLLTQAGWARDMLKPHAGRRARFATAPWSLSFTVAADGHCVAADAEEADDVTISLPPDAPLLALQGLDKLIAAAHVAGNAEFATTLSFVFKNLRWDYEEDLSRWVGDIAAHRIAGGLQSAAAWRQDAGERLRANLVEYATEEQALLVRADDFTAHRDELTRFAQALTQLEKRVAALC